MTTRQLHNLVIPADAQTLSKTQLRNRVGSQGALQADLPSVTAISLDSDQYLLRGRFRGALADKCAAEVEELFRSQGISEVVFVGKDATTAQDGYYALEDVSVEQETSQTQLLQKYDGVLTFKGTRRSHWRAFTTADHQPENGFGNDQTSHVGVPAAATMRRWYDTETKATENMTSSFIEARAGEFGDVRIYDAKASSFDDPTAIFALDYTEEWKTACRVWDTRGNASKLNASDVPQWGRVFVTSHDFDGELVAETGLLRLTFDEPTNTLTAAQWDAGTSSWSAVALGSSGDAPNWQLWDVDVREIGLARVVARTVWEDTTDGSRFALDCIAKRGYETALWVVPDGETPPTPPELLTKLDPVANEQDFDSQESQTVIRKREVDA